MSAPSSIPFGTYNLHRRIARGGMAEVFLATAADDPDGRLVALKRILPDFSEDPEFVRMFLDEVKIVRELEHPNVAVMHDFGQVGRVYFLTMDFVAGVNLRTLVRRGHPVPQEIICEIAHGVASALEHAHALTDDQGVLLNIVHRDVTPHNIMVSFDGDVKLLDFGIAKARTQAERTRAGVLKGKYAYMPPEQIRGKPLDARADVFSLGAVMYEALTGVRPFAGATPVEVLRLITDTDPNPPRRIRHDIHPILDEIVLTALSRDPGRRYQSAGEMKSFLYQFLSERSKIYPPKELSLYTRELFPKRYEAVLEVGEEVREAKPQERRQSPSRVMAPSAPFEEKADDIDDQAPTTVWQREDDSAAPSMIVRRRRRRKAWVVLAVIGGVLFGVGLGMGLFFLLTPRPPPPMPDTPTVRQLPAEDGGDQN